MRAKSIFQALSLNLFGQLWGKRPWQLVLSLDLATTRTSYPLPEIKKQFMIIMMNPYRIINYRYIKTKIW